MHRFIAYFGLTILLACTSKEVNLDYKNILGKDAIPLHLNDSQMSLPIQDFLPAGVVDSLTISGNGYQVDYAEDSLRIICSENADYLGVLNFWFGGNVNSILVKKSNKREVEFSFPNQGKVQLKGEMNAWNVNDQEGKIVGEDRVFTYNVNPGRYQYQFVVDDIETLDPKNSSVVDNGFGGFNSVLELPRPLRSELPIISTVSYDEKGIYLNLSKEATKVFVFCGNQLHKTFENMEAGSLLINPPHWSRDKKREHLRLWAMNAKGVGNDVLIPLEYGKPLHSVDQLDRKDWHASIMYFMMVDRFKNGNQENDRPTQDPDIHPKANYFGGDLDGIEECILEDYFSQLGVNTLWLSPITQNPEGAYGLYPEPYTKFSAYHGYWPISNSKVDDRFGTRDELNSLINSAHLQDMNVILDYVANHVHQEHPLYKAHPDWSTNLYLPDSTLNTEKWDEHRLTTWFDTFMPTLDLSRKEVYEPMTDSALFWVQNADFDGFRHDATKHVPEIFWRTLTRKVKDNVDMEERPIFQIGETYGSRELISSYISNGQLDAQFDFNVYDDMIQVFANEEMPMTRLQSGLIESLHYYGNHNLMGYISGNQDKPRFISLSTGAVRFDEDTKKAGWTRKIENEDPKGFKKLNQVQAFIMTIPGIPCLYYGDEFGSPGGNDPDNRRMMKFGEELSNNERETLTIAKKIINKRKEHLALIYGDFQFIDVDDSHMVYKRKYFDDEVWVLFNKSDESKEISLEFESKLNSLFQGELNSNKIVLPPLSFEILTK
ncbi:MAG: alpha-amylase family glycosyl hydrolase [Bacteroidota bacterium]